MPTYAYACTECGHTFDIYQSFSDASLTVCPQCEGRLRKVFSSVGVIFKGSGFYRTDSRSKSTSSASAVPSGSGSTGGASSSTSSTSGTATSAGSSDSKPSTASTSSSAPASTSSSPAAKK